MVRLFFGCSENTTGADTPPRVREYRYPSKASIKMAGVTDHLPQRAQTEDPQFISGDTGAKTKGLQEAAAD